MQVTAKKKPVIAGVALVGSAAAAAGITLAIADSGRTAPQPVPLTQQIPVDVTTPAAAITPAARPVTPTATPTRTAVTLDQARGIAERVGNGRMLKVDTETIATGAAYDITVIRADGTEVDLLVDVRSGRVLSSVADQPEPQEQPNVGDQPSVPEPIEVPEQPAGD
jgi:uncharacterized membrane protein YkoI